MASSTAIETGQSVQLLEQKLKAPAKHRFAHVKLAPLIHSSRRLRSLQAYSPLEQFEADLVRKTSMPGVTVWHG